MSNTSFPEEMGIRYQKVVDRFEFLASAQCWRAEIELVFSRYYMHFWFHTDTLRIIHYKKPHCSYSSYREAEASCRLSAIAEFLIISSCLSDWSLYVVTAVALAVLCVFVEESCQLL